MSAGNIRKWWVFLPLETLEVLPKWVPIAYSHLFRSSSNVNEEKYQPNPINVKLEWNVLITNRYWFYIV